MTSLTMDAPAAADVMIPFVPAVEPHPTPVDVVTPEADTVADEPEELEWLWELVEMEAGASATANLPADLCVSVVIPVHNAKRTVLEVIGRVKALPFEKEIIVVDDGSTDGTRGWLETLRGAPGLHLICHEERQGQGAALRAGLQAATGHVIVVQDANLRYDPANIERLVRPITAGDADVVYGSRYLAAETGRLSMRRTIDRALTSFSNLFTGLRLSDIATAPKAFRREVISDLPLTQKWFGFESEVTARLARRGYCVREAALRPRVASRLRRPELSLLAALGGMYCVVRYACAE